MWNISVGKGLADELAKDYYDEDDDTWLPPLIDCNNEEQVQNIFNGNPIIYGIRASAEVNHNMGMAIKKYTQKQWVHLYPLSADEQRKIDLTSDEDRLLAETEETRMEILNIQNKPISGSVYVKFFSTSKRKDRWSAMCMALYGMDILTDERLKKKDELVCMYGVSSRR